MLNNTILNVEFNSIFITLNVNYNNFNGYTLAMNIHHDGVNSL